MHNVWWYHDASGSKRFAFVGEEGSGTIGSTSRGDIHVVDVSDMTAPHEVGVYHIDGAGTHNFSVDEVNGVLYAAYYNGGIRAIDIRGDLGTCLPAQQDFDGPSGLTRCDLRLSPGRRSRPEASRSSAVAFTFGVSSTSTGQSTRPTW